MYAYYNEPNLSTVVFYKYVRADPLMGSTGHLTHPRNLGLATTILAFQTLMGSAGHLAFNNFSKELEAMAISNPHGLLLPFRPSINNVPVIH
jgi:hypothetical protein